MCLASVVPDVTGQFREMAAAYLSHEPLVVGPGMKTGVSVLTDNPREVGADRVVNTLAAFTMFGGPAIVVDFGTGTNFDVVSERRGVPRRRDRAGAADQRRRVVRPDGPSHARRPAAAALADRAGPPSRRSSPG